MYATLFFVYAWSQLHEQQFAYGTRYNVAQNACEHIAKNTRTPRPEALLSFTKRDCKWVRESVQVAFDSWGVARFQEGRNYTISVGVTRLQTGTIGEASAQHISLSETHCWHGSMFCEHVGENGYIIFYIVTATVASFSVLIACIGYKKNSLASIVVPLVPAVAAPWIWFEIIEPCFKCISLYNALLHETGHVLGLGHAEPSANLMCGCGSSAKPCTKVPIVSVMKPNVSNTVCPSRDDFDGVNTIQNATCMTHDCLFESHSSWYASMLLILLYSFMLYILLVAILWSLRPCRRNSL